MEANMQTPPRNIKRGQIGPDLPEPGADLPASPATPVTVNASHLLPIELLHKIFGHLDECEHACTLRLLCKSFAALTPPGQLRLSRAVPFHAFKRRWGAPSVVRDLPLKQRRRFIYLTALSGALPNLELAAELAGCSLIVGDDDIGPWDLMAGAASGAHRDVCDWLHRMGLPLASALPAAAERGHLDFCAWLLDRGCLVTDAAVFAAARGGREDLMRWLLRQRKCDDQDLDAGELLAAAAEGLALPTLEQLYQQVLRVEDGDIDEAEPRWRRLPPEQKAAILAAAARSPTSDWSEKVLWLMFSLGYRPSDSDLNLEVASRPDVVRRLKWMHRLHWTLDARMVLRVAQTDNVHALPYLLALEPHMALDSWVASEAAAGGHLAALRFLHRHRFPIDPAAVIRSASKAGHLAVVAWAAETFGVSVGSVDAGEDGAISLFNLAASSGSVELMAWLHERGCRWGANTYEFAVDCGSSASLEWLAEHGGPAPVDPLLYKWAATHGNLAALRHLHRLGCPTLDDGGPYWAAAVNGDLATLRCLQNDLGYPWSPRNGTFEEWVRLGVPLSSLRWFGEEAGFEVDWDAGVRVLPARFWKGGDRKEVLMWLRRTQREQQRQLEEECGEGGAR